MWLPVVFICLLSDECMFMGGSPTPTRESCSEAVLEARRAIDRDPLVAIHAGACLPVKLQMV
jgi:hypothetical protein